MPAREVYVHNIEEGKGDELFNIFSRSFPMKSDSTALGAPDLSGKNWSGQLFGSRTISIKLRKCDSKALGCEQLDIF